jgi:hypothetical protein
VRAFLARVRAASPDHHVIALAIALFRAASEGATRGAPFGRVPAFVAPVPAVIGDMPIMAIVSMAAIGAERNRIYDIAVSVFDI